MNFRLQSDVADMNSSGDGTMLLSANTLCLDYVGGGCNLVAFRTDTHLLVELSPSWEAANCAATRELPRSSTVKLRNLLDLYLDVDKSLIGIYTN
jgi:hypothetical protein